MRAGFRIEAFLGKAEALNGPAGDQMLGDDLRCVLRLHVTIPDGLGIDDDRGAVLALIEAAGFVDAHLTGESGGFCVLLQLGVQLAGSVNGAGGSWRAGGAVIEADKDVMFKRGQAGILRRAAV